jgi:signal recognition particle GTPase
VACSQAERRPAPVHRAAGEGLAGLSKRKIDREALDELEELLITSDMGAKVAARIAKAFSKDRFDREVSGDEIKAALASEIAAILKPREQVVDFSEGPKPRIVLFVGVNGSGKTTTIGKIASKLSGAGRRHRSGRRRHLPRGCCRAVESLGGTRERALYFQAARCRCRGTGL